MAKHDTSKRLELSDDRIRRGPGIAVLGMHRSGTSCLTGLLEDVGVYLGEVSKWNPHNHQGNQESCKVTALNDDVLAANGASWDKPPTGVCNWTTEQVIRRDEFLGSYAGFEPWAFKDPRTLLTIEGWLTGVARLHLVGTFRHPLDVARSLGARNGGSLEEWLELWFSYNERLLSLLITNPFPLVCFDSSSSDYLAQVRQAAATLGLDIQSSLSFFAPTLRHQNHETESLPTQIPQECLFLYRELRQHSLAP